MKIENDKIMDFHIIVSMNSSVIKGLEEDCKNNKTSYIIKGTIAVVVVAAAVIILTQDKNNTPSSNKPTNN